MVTSPDQLTVTLRTASADDLPRINAVIERAIQIWDLPERVKRLSLPIYTYDPVDLSHLEVTVAEAESILGVGVWGLAGERDAPQRQGGLLHGIYVDPAWHRQGIGTRLLEEAMVFACANELSGILVKAQRGAEGFFRARGWHALPVLNPGRDYPYRYWCDVGKATPDHALSIGCA